MEFDEDGRVAYAADLTYIDGRLLPDRFVIVEDGVIRSVATSPGSAPVKRWRGRALMPGFVNAHSHAFQRVIRGRVQGVQTASPEADFWSWRAQMYRAAEALGPAAMAVVSRFAFLEMILAGYTSVAEFHYMHHGPGGRPYDDPGELGRAVLAGARSARMRIALLPVAYGRGGPGIPLEGAQRRFAHASVEGFLETAEALRGAIRGGPGPLPQERLGVAIHSVRAVPASWMGPIADYAAAHEMPLHAHACEQPRENALCAEEHGMGPIALLEREGALSPRATIVHGVHLAPGDVERLGAAGATVCACPTTERDLGDGILPVEDLRGGGVGISLGSDSHAQIDPFAEMQGLEGHARLRSLRRCRILGPDRDGVREVGSSLIDIATLGGQPSLGLPVGRLAAGLAADFIGLDLGHPSMVGVDPEHLPSAIALSGGRALVREVVIAGAHVVSEGHLPGIAEATEDFAQVVRALYGR